jgi:hypothetical protein
MTAGEPEQQEPLLAAAEGLAAQESEDRPARARESSVRRRPRMSRGRTQDGAAILNVDDGAGEERVRVRSLADEPGKVGARPPVDPVAEAERQVGAPAQADADDVMLDAAGNEIHAPRASGSDAAVITTAVFLADAVRAYLDGREELGAEHAVTLDRLANLRRTLDRFEAELDA